MKKQLRSFRCALNGVWNTIKSESHMRFHMVAGFYVVLFSLFYSFSVSQWAVLILLIAAIMAAETVNTCIEELCDLTTDRYEPLVRMAKDAAAGAVLVLAVGAAIIAVIFFWNTAVIAQIFTFFAHNIFMLVLLALSAVLAVLFVWLGPVGIKKAFLRLKHKLKKS